MKIFMLTNMTEVGSLNNLLIKSAVDKVLVQRMVGNRTNRTIVVAACDEPAARDLANAACYAHHLLEGRWRAWLDYKASMLAGITDADARDAVRVRLFTQARANADLRLSQDDVRKGFHRVFKGEENRFRDNPFCDREIMAWLDSSMTSCELLGTAVDGMQEAVLFSSTAGGTVRADAGEDELAYLLCMEPTILQGVPKIF